MSRRYIFTRKPLLGFRVLLLILCSLALLFLETRSETLKHWRDDLSVLVFPLQWTANLPIRIEQWFSSSMMGYQKLASENEALKANQLLLQAKLQRFTAVEAENNQLRQLLESSTQISGRVQVAQILAVSVDPAMQEMIVDAGTPENIFVGQPVLDAYGVMGQVVAVGPITSKVLLLSDPRSAIPIQDTRSGVRAIAVGAGVNAMRLMDVPATEDIQKNDVLVSSGLGQRYPAGFPVGTVLSVKNNPGQQFAQIEIAPAAHLDRSQQVLLLWPTGMNLKNEVAAQLAEPIPVVGQDE